jgi:UDP-N-acetylmuramate dehydrogenase
MSRIEQQLRERFGARLQIAAPLAELTSFRIGGPADLLLEVENDDELRAAMSAAWRERTPAFCLGAGTNLLISDLGVRGLVIRLGAGLAQLEFDGVHVRAGAAAQFGALVYEAVERGLAGLEFGEGIPGSVGGGLVMNAGAFGGEIARVVRNVHGVTERGESIVLTGADVNFSYRRTDLPPRFVITRVDFELECGNRDQLRARVAELRARRAARQPRGLPNAGSVFKNPPGNFAGRLLEQAGLKGARLGAAAFSSEHANFIVNLGGARAEDVRGLIDLARTRVEKQSGVALEAEVRMVGEWR